MRNHNSITQKVSIPNRSSKDQDRDINGRFISPQEKPFYSSHRSKGENKYAKESYNGGSTYGEHQ